MADSIQVLHEDEAVLAIAKPEGISTITERDPKVPSVHRLLEAERGERLFVVHRLDKEVSGLVLFARTAEAHRALSMAFEARRVDKTYLALAHGSIEGESGAIEKPIAQFGSGRMGVVEDARRGKPSRTEWTVRRRYAASTLVEARPITGRRHQIRVHFYAIGHPLVGDPRYGDRAAQARWPRLMLHALRLRVTLPDGSELSLEAEPPKSFTSVLDGLA